MVKNNAKVYLGGPPLVKMATGEEVEDEALGGADMHSKISGFAIFLIFLIFLGVSDFLAQDEHHAIRIAREIVHNLNYKKQNPLDHKLLIEQPFYDPGFPALFSSLIFLR
jgi:acetyl-CoA carboxylase carboxyltransferase component